MRTQRSQRGKEEVLTECPQIFAALLYEDDLQKLVKLLLVSSIVRERVYRLSKDTSLSFGKLHL